MKRKFIFLAMLLLTLIGGVKWNVLNAQEIAYRIKVADNSNNGNAGVNQYLHINNHDQHPNGAKGGVGISNYAEDYNQIFTIENTDNGFYLRSIDGYYIFCQQWNVDAFYTTTLGATELTKEDLSDGTFYLKRSNQYFKVGLVDGTANEYAPYCDATQSIAAKWVLEPVVDNVTPAVPTELTATKVTHNSVTLSWTDGADALKYNVYRDGNKIVNNIIGTTYTDETVQALTTYNYTVESVRFSNVSSTHSNEVSVTTLEIPAIQPFEIADGTTATSNYIPTNFYYSYSLTQQIYTAEQLGFGAGTISEIAFYRHGTGADRTRSIDVYMINTDKSSFTANNDWVVMNASNKVFSGTFTGTTNGWSTIDINDFEYDGSNLLICIDDNTGSYSSNTPFKLNSTTTNTAIYIYNDGTNYDPANPPTNATGRIAKNNQIKFTVELKPVVPIVDVNVENITFETPVRGGNYWSEKSGVQPIEVVIAPKGGAEVTNIELVDNTFFSIPTDIDLTANPISFNVSTGTSNEEGNKTATLRITHTAEGGIIDIPVTANVYIASQGDVIENPITVTFDENGSYTYEINSLENYKDDYIFIEGEQYDANCSDLVFEFSLSEKALVTIPNYDASNDYVGSWLMLYGDFTTQNGPQYKTTSVNQTLLEEGTYYVVISPNSTPFNLNITKESVPTPEISYSNPYNGATNQENPVLTWNMNYAEEYQLLLGTSEEEMVVVVDWTSELATSYQTENLQNNTQYFWQVNARNEAGITTGEVYSFVTLLNIPTEVAATAVNLYPGEATTISWTAAEDATEYNVYVNGEKVATTTETSYELSELAYNMTGYNVTVSATHALGESLQSEAVVVKVAGEFPLVVSVKDSNGNPIEGATVSIDMTKAYDEFKNQVASVEVMTTNAEGTATVTLPVLGGYDQYGSSWFSPYYLIEVSKYPYGEYAGYTYYYNISNGTPYTSSHTLSLPTISWISFEEQVVTVGSDIVLTWSNYGVEEATAYNVYKKPNGGVETLVGTVTTNELTITAEHDNIGSKYGVSAVFGDIETSITYTSSFVYVLGNGSFSGFVYDKEGNSIAGLTVKLSGTNAIGEDVVILTTDAEGYFEGEVLEGDDYTLTISHYDYEKVDIPGIEIEYSNNTDLLDIVLTAKPSVEDIEVIATDKGEYANVTWTGDYAKYNVYRQAENEEPELLGEGDAETKAYTDIEWADLNYGNYKYGVSAFVEEEQQSRGVEVIFEEDFENGMQTTIWNKFIDNKGSATYWYATSGYNGIKSPEGGNFAYTYGTTYDGYTTLATENYIAIPENAKLIFDYYSKPWGADKDYMEVYAVDEYNNKHLLHTTNVYSEWVTEEVSLAQFAGQTVKIWFKCIIKYGYGVALDNIKITGEGSSAKESKIVWSTTVEKKAPNTFEGTVSTYWNNPDNWSNGEVPADGADVIINANAVISSDANVNVKNLNIKSGNLTIEGILAVTGTITNNGNLIINDGAQLFQNNEDINATFNMSIISPDNWKSNNKEGWQFISSPFLDATVASFVPSEGEYDLYKYDGTQDLEWVNHKGGNSDEPGTDADTEFFFDFNDGSMEGLRVFQGENATGDNWQVTPDNGDFAYFAGDDDTKGIYSYSFNNGQFYPYNYVVTEKAYAITETSVLTWFIRPTDPMYGSDDKYDVVASTDGVTFDIVLFSSNGNGLNENELSLAEHAGKTLYIGFYHYTEGGQPGDALVLDNIRLSSGSRSQTRGTSSFEKTFANGSGYLASYEIAATVALNGELNPNTIKTWGQYYYNAEKDLANLRLLGNPFTFDMDMSKLSSYGMATGYAVVNANGEYEYKTDGIVNVGDGFFVKVAADYATLTYDHSYVAPVLRGSEKANSINVIASGKAGKDNVVVNFAGQAEGFNKLQNFNDAIATVYVTENGKNYGIANVDENTTEVALNFDAKEMGNYTISLDVNGEFETVTLVDRFTGVETNMLLEDEYTFTATSNDNVNRFVIRLANGQEPTANSQFVYQSGEELILSIEGSVQIVDMLGRVVYYNEHANGDNRINVAEFNDAAYVVRVVNEEGVKTQKVVIY